MPSESEAAAAMDEGWGYPTDTLVEILLRLPPGTRRRFRLVCRHWRNVIDERTSEMQSRAKTLVFVGDTYPSYRKASAYVFDDLSEGFSRGLWNSGMVAWTWSARATD